MTDAAAVPLELTAPSIQRILRKGLSHALTDAERVRLYECVLFHVDDILARRRVPKVGMVLEADDAAQRP